MRNEVERAITFKISDRIIIHKRVLVTGIIIFVELQLLMLVRTCFWSQATGTPKLMSTNLSGLLPRLSGEESCLLFMWRGMFCTINAQKIATRPISLSRGM